MENEHWNEFNHIDVLSWWWIPLPHRPFLVFYMSYVSSVARAKFIFGRCSVNTLGGEFIKLNRLANEFKYIVAAVGRSWWWLLDTRRNQKRSWYDTEKHKISIMKMHLIWPSVDTATMPFQIGIRVHTFLVDNCNRRHSPFVQIFSFLLHFKYTHSHSHSDRIIRINIYSNGNSVRWPGFTVCNYVKVIRDVCL